MVQYTKVIKLQLFKPLNESWDSLEDALRKVQRETHEALNKTIQYCWEYYGFSSDYKKNYNPPLKIKEVLNYSNLQGFAYDQLKENYSMNRGNLSQTIKRASDKWKSDLKEIKSGERSIPSFKKNPPINVVKQSLKLEKNKMNKYMITVSLFNTKHLKKIGKKREVI